jgi:hypothetical protein
MLRKIYLYISEINGEFIFDFRLEQELHTDSDKSVQYFWHKTYLPQFTEALCG